MNSNVTLEDLRFTLAYESPNRLSEFIGIDNTTKNSTDAELMEIYNRSHAEYLVRQRDGKTWQSVHSVVYDNKQIKDLYVQEDYSVNYAKDGKNITAAESSELTIGSGLEIDINNVLNVVGKEDTRNKTLNISSASTDTEYPSAKAVYDYIQQVLANQSNS